MMQPGFARGCASGAGLATACALVLAFLAWRQLPAQPGQTGGSWGSNGISESSSGALFRAVKVRSYQGPRRFAGWRPRPDAKKGAPSKECRQWAVVTSIFPPTQTVRQLAALPSWCVVVAGDKKGPVEYNLSGVLYLTPAMQAAWTSSLRLGSPPCGAGLASHPRSTARPAHRCPARLLSAWQEALPFESKAELRWNHFGRKNLGFLYAIQHGARWVYDTDDDNELLFPGPRAIPIPPPDALADEVYTSARLYNLYHHLAVLPGKARSPPHTATPTHRHATTHRHAHTPPHTALHHHTARHHRTTAAPSRLHPGSPPPPPEPGAPLTPEITRDYPRLPEPGAPLTPGPRARPTRVAGAPPLAHLAARLPARVHQGQRNHVRRLPPARPALAPHPNPGPDSYPALAITP